MTSLSPLEIGIIVAAIAVVLIVAAVVYANKRRRDRNELQDRFGSEYDRTVEDAGSRRKAEAELHDREKRVEKFKIVPLSPERRTEFVNSWRAVQAQFVDDPRAAVTHADQLLGTVMQARGYPVSDFDQRAADLSVDHAEVVQNYRAGHDIALRHERGEASTEDLRQAMIHYRALFDDLVNEPAVRDGQGHDPVRETAGQPVASIRD